MKYDVHLYATSRVKVCGIEANSQQEAIKKAEEQTDLYETLGEAGHGSEYAEEITGFLVDESDDCEFKRSRFYDSSGCLLRQRPARPISPIRKPKKHLKVKPIPDPDGQNENRARWAGEALTAFQSITGTDDCDAVKDLLCDLMHYCQQNGQDFDVALDAARHHHKAETTEG